MITPQTYGYLRMILSTRPIEHPVPQPVILPSGFEAQFLKCHLTCAQVAVELGHIPIVGVAFLDKAGKLYPWPHMANLGAHGGLVDHSPQPMETNLGFVRTGWDEWQQWRAVTVDYTHLMPGMGPTWGDPLADHLSQEFLPALRAGLMPPPIPPV